MNPRTCSVQRRQGLQSLNMSNHGMHMCVRLVKFHFVAESRKALAAVGWHRAAFRIGLLNSSGNRAHFSRTITHVYVHTREVVLINSYPVTLSFGGLCGSSALPRPPLGRRSAHLPWHARRRILIHPPSLAPFGLGTRGDVSLTPAKVIV